MKKYWLIYLFLIFSLATSAQRVNVSYLAPTSGDTINYHYLRLGTPDNYFGGLMHNLSHEAYGDGNDFTIYSYGNRDLVLRAGTGRVILAPHDKSNVGLGAYSLHDKLTVNGATKILGTGETIGLTNIDNGYLKIGNSLGIDPNEIIFGTTGYIGTVNSSTLHFTNNGNKLATILPNGRFGIGTTYPRYTLDVDGAIRAKEIRVESSGADFVFADDYNLLTLSELKAFITQNKHLPEIAPAQKMQEEGMAVGELNTKLLQKVEELTLYMIQQNERMDQLSQENKLIKQQNEQLKAQQKELLQLKARIEKLENK